VIVFWLTCALLIVLALAFVLPPLRHPGRIRAASTETQANVAVYRGQLAEMASDLRHQIITDEQFVGDREELEQRLFGDLPRNPRDHGKNDPASGSGMLGYALAVGLPVAATLLYLTLGTPSTLPQIP
jgi:cytochrome c-type biogenesis protein CcmH